MLNASNRLTTFHENTLFSQLFIEYIYVRDLKWQEYFIFDYKLKDEEECDNLKI